MTTLGELLYALVVPLPPDAGEAYSVVAGGSLFELYGGDGHSDCDMSVYCRNPLHPGPCKGWKKHLGLTAPGVLSALEKAQKEKLAISRARRAAAKAEAEKIVHGKLGMSAHPLHQKQLTVKHAKTILTGDENKAVQQASKVILNKTEIKRYAKLKAAQIAANGGHWAGVADQAAYSKNLEAQIANALTLDSSEGSTHHLTNLLADTSDALAAQFTNRQLPGCAKGDHDCDGLAFEALKDHLSTSLYRGLRDGDMDEANRQAAEVKELGGDPAKIREWLNKEGVDLKAPEMEVTPPETKPAKVGAPRYSTLKAAGLKPGDKVYLHVVSHDGKKHAATTSDVNAANTHTTLATVDASNGGKTVFHDDETGEKIAGGYAAKKYFLTEAEGHPLTDAALTKPNVKPKTQAKVDQQLSTPDKVGKKLDEAFGPPPKSDPAMEVLTDQQLINGIKMHGTSSPKGKLMVAELAARGLNPDGGPLETLESGGAKAAPAIPLPSLQGGEKAAERLDAYQKLDANDLAGLTPEHRAELKADLTKMAAKLHDPTLKKQAQETLDKLFPKGLGGYRPSEGNGPKIALAKQLLADPSATKAQKVAAIDALSPGDLEGGLTQAEKHQVADLKLSENAQYAKDIANGVKSAGTLGKLGGYKKLTKEDFDSLDPATQAKITKWLDDTAADTSNMGVINHIAQINKKLGIGDEPAIRVQVMHEVKPNDLTPNEAAQGNAPKATEWVQPGKFDGWLPSQDVKKIIVGAKTPSTDQEAKAWVDSVDKLPKSQFDNLVPDAQDAITKGLADEHELWQHADPAHAEKIEAIHKKLTGLGTTFEPLPDFPESPPADELEQAVSVGNALKTALKIGVGNTEMLHLVKSYPEAYDGLDDGEKHQIKGILQAKYLLGTPEESGEAQSLAILHKINLADEGGEVDPFGAHPFGEAPKSETMIKLLEHAKPKEQGGKWALAKTKLPLYQELGDDELASLTPEEKGLLMTDLSDMALKFKDPKKIAAVAAIQNKISKAHGGGAGAGGTSHIETPAIEELNTVSPAAAKLIASNVEKLMATVKKTTGVDSSESMTTTITESVTKMIAEGDNDKLLQAVSGPATAIAKHVSLNNDLLNPHKEELKDALQHDLAAMLKSGIGADTPVLDAVDKWGMTKVLKANAAAKITEALANHPTQQGVSEHTVSDTVLGYELAKHAGEVGPPSALDPADYEHVGKWLGTHAIGNALVDAGLLPSDLDENVGSALATSLLDQAEKALQADYAKALFDGKTTPDGLAGELPDIIKSIQEQHVKFVSQMGWKGDSPGAVSAKAGTLFTKIEQALKGHPSGEGGAATKVPDQVKNAVADALTPGGLSDGQKISLKQAYKSFGSTSYLKESTVEQNFDNLLAVASAYSGEEGMGKLTFGSVMDAIDEQMATELGVVNGKLLRKKITDWLETPAGKNYADSASPKTQLLTVLTGKLAEQKEIAEWQKKNQLPKHPGPGEFDAAKAASDFKNLTVSDGYAEHTAELEKLGKKISPAQKSALVNYSGSGASYMNDWLRTGKSYGGINTIKEAHLVDEAMYPTPTDKHMIRRTGWEFVPPQFRSAEAIKGLIGGTFKDPAFMSTTYYQTPGSYGSGLPVVLDMEIPKGTRGFHLDHWSHFKGTENEWLMAAGQTLQIMDVQVITDKHHALNPYGDKRVVVKVRVVNGDDE